jgi:MscS family membrane protein
MRIKIALLFLLVSSTVISQQSDLKSPRATFQTFYNNLQGENINEHKASKVIYSRLVSSRSIRIELVGNLKAYLDQKAIVIIIDSIPDNNDYLDSISNKSEYEVTDGIFLAKYGKNWYFSKETTDEIPNLIDSKGEVADGKVGGGNIISRREEAAQAREEELEKISHMKVDLSTPYATIKFYIENIEVDPAIASRVISNRDISHLDKRIEIATKLDRFFNGKGVLLDLDKVPDDPDFTDSLKVGKHTFELSYRFADLYLEKEGKNWYLSKESAEMVPELYELAFPFGSDRLLQYLPTRGRVMIFGLAVWQYVAILLIIILTYLIFRFLNWAITFIVTKMLFRFGYKDLARKYVNPVAKPIGWLIAFVLAETATPFLQLPIKVTAFVTVTVSTLIPLFATIALYKAIDIVGLYMKKIADNTESTFDDQLVPLIRKVLKSFVVIIGGIYVLSNLNVDMAVLFGTLSVGGLALALAAQDTIKNFFGSLMIFMDKPFQAGHWIVTPDGIDGTVEQVGFRSTRIRTFANSIITVPNGKLSDASIDNFGLRSYRRFKMHISVTYDTPPDVLELYVEGLRDIVRNHPHTRKDMFHIHMNDMGSHSLNILFYIFFITPSWAEELKYRHEIIISIMKLAENLGVHFAFPTQTLHMENFPGQDSLSPNYEPADKLKGKMNQFLDSQKGEEKNKIDE